MVKKILFLFLVITGYSHCVWFSNTPQDSLFSKRSWKVEAKSKNKTNDYNVIVVGSGIGGLSCAALLAKKGYNVLVLEQYKKIGGYCGSFSKDRYRFNIGVSNVSGLWEKGPITYLLKKLDLRQDDLFIKNRRKFVFKNTEYTFDTKDQIINLLCTNFPKEKQQIKRFFADVEKLYDELYSNETATYGFPFQQELITDVLGTYSLLSYPFSHPTVMKWNNKSYKEKLDSYFKDEDLKQFFCSLLSCAGTIPEQTGAIRGLATCMPYFIFGGYYPKKGAKKFAHALKDIIESNGGRVMCNQDVDNIIVKNNRVIGVSVKKQTFNAPIVVSNVNALTTFDKLITQKTFSKDALDELHKVKFSNSAVVVHCAVNKDLSQYPSIITNIDNDCHVVVNSSVDPSTAPKGNSSVTIFSLADTYNDIPERDTAQYKKYKESREKSIIQQAESVIPNLSKHVVFSIVTTPKTFERYTRMPKGALHSIDLAIGNTRPYFKTPIKGLYLSSASALYGSGIEGVIMTGMACAHDICGWKV